MLNELIHKFGHKRYLEQRPRYPSMHAYLTLIPVLLQIVFDAVDLFF